jgi:hypothetical protein
MTATEPAMPAATGKSTTNKSTSGFELPSLDQATKNVRALSEELLDSSKRAGLTTLDAYEKVVVGIADFEKKAASDTQIPWVSTIATAHAQVLSEMTASYTSAARSLLK